MKEVETINKLFLELSQFATATTAKEILLRKEIESLKQLKSECESEIEALKNQITAYQLTIENLEAERDRLVPAAVRGNNGYVKAKRDFPDIDSFLKACRDNTTLYEIEDKS